MINLEKEHKRNRTIIYAFMIFCSVVVIGVCGAFYKLYTKSLDSIYVLVDGNALQVAMRRNTTDNRPVEIKSHVRTLMNYLFTFNPDSKDIENNIKKAYELSDNSVKEFVDNLTEQKYYNRVISSNISQKLKLDTNSIQLDLSNYPYKVFVSGEIEMIRPTNITIREIKVSMNLRNLPNRSDNNPHALLVENFTVVSNKTVKSLNRSSGIETEVVEPAN